jgi:signal transduction histidine kinase/DNA-binding response OmpR family regulator/ligand-binding sensor domain-containing protein
MQNSSWKIFITIILFTVIKASGNICESNPFIFNHLTTQNGLLSNDIRSIDRDKEGYWWIGGDNGLQRFDGKFFKNYRHKVGEKGSLPSDRIFSIYTDRSGRVWIATIKGLCLYLPGEDCFKKFDLNLAEINLTFPVRFFEDNSGTLWLNSLNSGSLFRLKPKKDEWEKLNLPKGVKVFGHIGQYNGTTQLFSTFKKENGTIFFGKFLINKSDIEIIESILHPRLSLFNHFVIDHQNNLFANQILPNNEYDDIIKVNLTTLESQIYPIHNVKIPLHSGKDGKIWFFSPSMEIFGFIKEDNIVRYCWPILKENGQKLSSKVTYIKEDNEGNIWLASSNGLYVFNPYQYTVNKNKYLKTSKGVEEVFDVISFYETSDNKICIGTYFNGTYILDKKLNIIKKFLFDVPKVYDEPSQSSLLNFNSVWSFCEDHKGNIWAGGQHGVLMKLSSKGELLWKSLGNLFQFQTIRAICEDKKGNLWIGTHGGLLYKYNPENGSNVLVLNRSKNEGTIRRIRQLIPDKNNRMWVIYLDNIIYLDLKTESIIKNKQKINLNKSINLKGEIINGVTNWSRDSFFVYGFSQYWFRKSDHSFFKIDGSNKLPRDEILFAFKHNKDLWLDQKGLLVRWDPKTKKVVSYNSVDGWTNESLELNNAAIKLSDKRIIASFLSEGIGGFHPDSLIKSDKEPPNILINNIIVKEKNILFRKNNLSNEYFKLKHDENYFTIHFSCPSWLQRHHLIFSYKIGNKSNDWENIGKSRSLTLAGLTPGKYELLLQARNRLGLTSKIPAVVKIKIQPPWFLSAYAYLSYFAIIIFFLFHLNRFLIKRKLEISNSEKLKEIYNFKSEFFTNITHEFKTPITLIQGMANEIKQNPEKFLDTGLEIITRNGERLHQLVNQVLDLSKLDAGQLNPSFQYGNIIPFIFASLENSKYMAKFKNIDFSFSSEIDELMMEFEPEMIQQSLGNLISNAIKFTKVGGKVVVDVAVNNSGLEKFLKIMVIDEGIGVKKEDSEKIFDRFYQSKFKNEFSGTGIGLTLAREMARMMGGDVTLESNFGNGTIFSLSIPIKELSKSPNDEESSSENILFHSDKPLILIVEDNFDLLYYVKTILMNDYTILTALNGENGLEIAFEKTPDLIISDIMMPEMDGISFCRKIRDDIKTCHIPFIFLTAKAGLNNKLEGLASGADDYLTKPFSKEELLGRVKNILDQREKLKNFYLEKLVKEKEPNKTNNAISALDQKFLEQLSKIVEDRFSDPLFNVNDLERDMKMSHARFYRKIMAIIGINGNAYIRKVRINKSKDLLRENLYSISEIAYLCGFNESSYFSKVFKEETGMSPNDFRK